MPAGANRRGRCLYSCFCVGGRCAPLIQAARGFISRRACCFLNFGGVVFGQGLPRKQWRQMKRKYILRHCSVNSTISPPRFGYPLRAAVSVSDLPHIIFNRSRGYLPTFAAVAVFCWSGCPSPHYFQGSLTLPAIAAGGSFLCTCGALCACAVPFTRGGCGITPAAGAASRSARRHNYGGGVVLLGSLRADYLGALCLSRRCRSHRGRRWVAFPLYSLRGWRAVYSGKLAALPLLISPRGW